LRGTEVRLLATLAAGEATGSIALSWEADNYADYGAVMDKFMADPEGAAVLAGLGSVFSPIASFQGSVWIEVDL